MLEHIFIASISLMFFILIVLMVYLELFLIRRLYRVICLEKKQKHISALWGYGKRLKCLKGFVNVEPFTKDLKRAFLLHYFLRGLGVVLIVTIIVYKYLGYGQQPKITNITEKLTITKTEGNRTTVKIYKNLKEFFQ